MSVPPAIRSLAAAPLLWGTLGCHRPPPPVVDGEAGATVPGLTVEEEARFARGKAFFDHDFSPEEGLGPLYNQARCSSCHDVPVLGGSGTELVVKATRFADGRCDLLQAEGGDNLQQRVTGVLASHGITREKAPSRATHVTDLAAPTLFGLGLAEAVPEEVILSLADPRDRDGDGISGRVGRTPDGKVGRFGQKADAATVREFIAGALLQEMGLTTTVHPEELRPNGADLPADADPAPDPEVSDEVLDALVDFVRYLAPPAPARPADARDATRVARGRVVFEEIGCASCHTPVLETGPASEVALGERGVALYSDFLLHDMGPDNADICGPGASPSELRTARLAGLRLRPVLLHHGKGGRLEQALEMHGGEASASRAAFDRLPTAEREALLRFLATL